MIEKNPSTIIRPHAPRVGIHLPTPNDRMAAQTENQMKIRPKMYSPLPRLWKNSLNTATAVIVSVPPSQIGFEIQ